MHFLAILIISVATTVYDLWSYANRGLLELSLIFCPRIQNSAFLEIGRGCSLLRTLFLVDCSRISDSALSHIAQGCKNLTELSIRRGYEVLAFKDLHWFTGSLACMEMDSCISTAVYICLCSVWNFKWFFLFVFIVCIWYAGRRQSIDVYCWEL